MFELLAMKKDEGLPPEENLDRCTFTKTEAKSRYFLTDYLSMNKKRLSKLKKSRVFSAAGCVGGNN